MTRRWKTCGRLRVAALPRLRSANLSACRWIDNNHNVICIGKTGCGKSYMASALAHAACRRGFRTLYARVPRLLQELAIARADGTYARVLARIANLRVLVLDDFLIAPLKDAERRDLLEILEDRYDRSSTIITSQLPTDKWHPRSAIPRSPMRSATGSCTMPTCSPSRAPRAASKRDSTRPTAEPQPTPLMLVASLPLPRSAGLQSACPSAQVRAPKSAGIHSQLTRSVGMR